MGIDLENTSREYYREESRPNLNANMVNSDKGGCHRCRGALNSSKSSGNDQENRGPNLSGKLVDSRHKECVGDGGHLNSVSAVEPQEGMEFESKEEAFSFYKEYAKSVGFATIIKASRRSRISGKFIDAKFVCTRYGNKRETNTAETVEAVPNMDGTTSIPVKRKRGRINRSWSKTDCKACMHVKRRQLDGRWVICSFIKEHNHEIFPDEAYYFRGHRNLDLDNSNVDTLNAIRERTKKLFVAVSRKSGKSKKLVNKKKDNVMNQLGNAQHLALDAGDVQVMLDNFIYMQDENPNFFYAIDMNEDHCLKNVIWVDAKSRLDYGSFSDVVFFDTTYIKNEYKLPFVPLIGVNHHFQGILLGCALATDETRSTYVWLMRAWLKAMGEHAPSVILTDQDYALKEAVLEVFPNSRHCFCLWHILSKMPEKLSYVMRQHESFMPKFNKCIFKSFTDGQFEKRWWKIVDRFNLRNDMWFQSLYKDREKWVPTFMRDIFLAGMSTTQRSESIISFLDKYIQRRTTLKEFLDQYKAMLQEKCEEEAKADFESWHKQPGLKSPSPFGKQMATLYTHAIFRKFQVEVLGVVACHPRKESEEGSTKTFKVQDFEENQDFIVVWNETTSDSSCLCRSFEYSGFLCRHLLIVLQMFGAHSIPPQYILVRWTKNAKSRDKIRELSDEVKTRVQRYNDLCRRAFKLGDEGSLSQESYNLAFNVLEEALRKCEKVNNTMQSKNESTFPFIQDDVTLKTNESTGTSKKRQVSLSSASYA